MNDEQRIKVLEDEIKIIKNEVKSVLLDLREQYLNIQNPFNSGMVPSTGNTSANFVTESNPNTENYAGKPKQEVNGEEYSQKKSNDDQKDNTHVVRVTKLDDIGENIKSQHRKNMLLSPKPNEKTETESDLEIDNPDLSPVPNFDQQIEFSSNHLKPTRFNEDQKKQDKRRNNSEVDLVIIAGLAQWIDQTTTNLGKVRTEGLIEISFAMGHLDRTLKEALVKMIHLSQNDSINKSITTSDYLSTIAQLENLLTGSQMQGNALLSIFSMSKDIKNG